MKDALRAAARDEGLHALPTFGDVVARARELDADLAAAAPAAAAFPVYARAVSRGLSAVFTGAHPQTDWRLVYWGPAGEWVEAALADAGGDARAAAALCLGLFTPTDILHAADPAPRAEIPPNRVNAIIAIHGMSPALPYPYSGLCMTAVPAAHIDALAAAVRGASYAALLPASMDEATADTRGRQLGGGGGAWVSARPAGPPPAPADFPSPSAYAFPLR